MKKEKKKKNFKVKCSHCKTEFMYYDSEFRPFCFERCKMIDLGHWLDESYTVPVVSTQLDDDSEYDGEIKDSDDE